MSRQSIAESLLGGASLGPNGGYAPCPGAAQHSKATGPKDFRVILDGAPTASCFHSGCSSEVSTFNLEMRRLIWAEEHSDENRPRRDTRRDPAPEPHPAAAPARPHLDLDRIADFIRGCPVISEKWLAERSPIDPDSITTPEAFLAHLYREDEKVLIFTDQRSQGDFLAWKKPAELDRPAKISTYRLSKTKGVSAVASLLPEGAPEGVWFLVQPVSGAWEIKVDVTMATATTARETHPKYTRRSQQNVTAWRYFVLESDELSAVDWLRVLVHSALPIAAIYTSGKRSIHALVKIEVPSKSTWDAAKKTLISLVCPLGADPAALTAVRLSRLPCCMRGNEQQRLLYLDPGANNAVLRLLPALRAK
jgi:hypothetical protein